MALRRWVPYLLLVITSGLAVYAAAYVSAAAETSRHDEFHASAAETRHSIEVRLHTYLEVIRAGAALLAASNEVHHAELRAFVRHLELGERYPGIEGIGFSPRVARDNLSSVVRLLENDGGPRMRIHPAGARPHYQPIVFVEPAAGGAAIGFDLATDPAQREAMERARDTGQLALSALVDGGTTASPLPANSVVVYAPVYRTGAQTGTVEERRRAIHGFVFSPIRPELLLVHVAAESGRPIDFEIYDAAGEAATLIHASSGPTGRGAYQSSGLLPIGGREWNIVVRSVEPPPGLFTPAAKNALWGGSILAVLLFLITRIQIGAWETAKRHERELRARESQLQELVVREQAARAEAQAADRAKDDFLVGLSHELRTPMNAVLGWLTMLKAGSVREERGAHALEVIERNARVQARLIEDLLDVSRIVLGKMTVDLQPLALSTVVTSVLESLRPSATAKGVHLESRLGGPAPIRGDGARAHQVVWNLVSNAIKFTPTGGAVLVELDDDGTRVELRVKDSGAGIAPEFLPHVFERFRQADTSMTRAHSGLGLGLAIARHLMDLHGGEIEARSDGPGRGALFIARFPAAAGLVPVQCGAAAPVPHALQDLHVVVVDDDRDTRDMVAEALRTSGAVVVTAGSARQAYDQLACESADVLVSDIRMPEEDGISLLRRVRALPGGNANIPAIALTAYAREHDRIEALRAGFQLHLAKPIELADLKAAVAKLAAQTRRAPVELTA